MESLSVFHSPSPALLSLSLSLSLSPTHSHSHPYINLSLSLALTHSHSHPHINLSFYLVALYLSIILIFSIFFYPDEKKCEKDELYDYVKEKCRKRSNLGNRCDADADFMFVLPTHIRERAFDKVKVRK